MKIRICALRELGSASAASLPDVVISIGEVCEREEARLALRHLPDDRILRLEFADISQSLPGHRAPDAADLDRIDRHLALYAMGPGRRVLVHCSAGLSRSPAVALYCLLWEAARLPVSSRPTPADLYGRIKAASPFALPNPLIVAMAERRFGYTNGHDAGPFMRLRAEDLAASKAKYESAQTLNTGKGLLIW